VRDLQATRAKGTDQEVRRLKGASPNDLNAEVSVTVAEQRAAGAEPGVF
jgi:hypothetical protein